jgi:hypothetical protein
LRTPDWRYIMKRCEMKIIPARSTAQFTTGFVMFKGEGPGPGSCDAATAIRGLSTWVKDEYGR